MMLIICENANHYIGYVIDFEVKVTGYSLSSEIWRWEILTYKEDIFNSQKTYTKDIRFCMGNSVGGFIF